MINTSMRNGTASLVEVMYGADYEIRSIHTDDEVKKITIDMYSQREEAVCPRCGQVSRVRTGGTHRQIQDAPIQPTYSTYIEFHGRKFTCENPDCPQKSFDEPVQFAEKKAHATYRFNLIVLIFTIMLSYFASAEILNLLGFVVSHDKLRLMFQDQSIVYFADDPFVEEIGIDDVANRSGTSYFTMIYRSSDHTLLAMLNDRDGKELEQWLNEHPHVKKVCRDRDSAYAEAIDKVCGERCIQIADRFHLVDNQIDHLKDMFYEHFPVAVAVMDDGVNPPELMNTVPAKIVKIETTLTEEQLKEMTYTNDLYVDENGNFVVVNARLSDPDSKQSKANAAKRLEKYNLVRQIRDAHNNLGDKTPEGDKIRSKVAYLAKVFGLSPQTVKSYIDFTDEEVEALKEVRATKDRATGFDAYKNIAYKMLLDGIDINDIVAYIKLQGCTLADLTILRHIEAVQMHHFPERSTKAFGSLKKKAELPEGVHVFSRNAVFRDLVTVTAKRDEDLQKYMDLLYARYHYLLSATQCQSIKNEKNETGK